MGAYSGELKRGIHFTAKALGQIISPLLVSAGTNFKLKLSVGGANNLERWLARAAV